MNGQFEKADAAYAEAIAAHKGFFPLPLASMLFQRGVMWAEHAGDMVKGRASYLAALRLVPNFALAKVHLAEMDWEQGTPESREKAIVSLLGSVAQKTREPETYVQLSTWLAALSPAAYQQVTRHKVADILPTTQSEAVNSFRAKALAIYASIMDSHAAGAYYDHAATFYFDIGDKARAVALAKANLANRQTPAAYALLKEVGGAP